MIRWVRAEVSSLPHGILKGLGTLEAHAVMGNMKIHSSTYRPRAYTYLCSIQYERVKCDPTNILGHKLLICVSAHRVRGGGFMMDTVFFERSVR